MAETDHIFHSSGEACPLCASLDGMAVPAGYTAHDNCMCQTLPPDEDTGCRCRFEYVHAGNSRFGSGSFDVISGIEITVYCENGDMIGSSIEYDGSGAADLDEWAEGFEEAAEDAAQELCDECPEPEPFNCC